MSTFKKRRALRNKSQATVPVQKKRKATQVVTAILAHLTLRLKQPLTVKKTQRSLSTSGFRQFKKVESPSRRSKVTGNRS